jgi:hypothetical protein
METRRVGSHIDVYGTFFEESAQRGIDPSGSHDKTEIRSITMPDDPNNPSSRFENLGRKIDDRFGSAVTSAEAELRRIIAYLNDEVVPQVRQHSSQALKAASERLARLAELLDREKGER